MDIAVAVIGTMALLGFLLLAVMWMNWKERGDLLDRLMARDLPELVTYQTERERVKIPTKDNEPEFVRL